MPETQNTTDRLTKLKLNLLAMAIGTTLAIAAMLAVFYCGAARDRALPPCGVMAR